MSNSVILGQGGYGLAGASNPSVGTNGGAAPTSSTEIGIIVSGVLIPISASNPLPITGTILASNPSVGLTGVIAPTSATELGIINNSGDLEGVSASNPIRIDPTGTTTQPVEINDGTNVMGLMAHFGTSPGAVYALNTNSSIFAGTTSISATGSSLNVNITGGSTNASVSGTGVTAPSFATEIGWVNGSGNLVDVSAATPLPVSGTFSATGSLSNNTAAPVADNIGTLPALANAASPTWIEGNQVLLSVDLFGRQRVRGTLTNNSAAPAADHQSSLNYIANAVAPTWVEGNEVLGSVDLNGNTRIIGTKTNNSAAPTTELGVIPALANAANPTWNEGDQVLLSVDLSGHQRVITGTGSTTAVTGNVTVVQPTGTNLHVVVDSLPLTTSTSGTLTNNTAAPTSDNLGVLPAIANAANPTWTEGDQVLLSVNLSGDQRVIINASLPAGTNVIGHVITDSGSTTVVTGSVAVTGTFFQATQPISGTVTANQGTANTAANSWPTEVTDGTNILFTAAHPGFIQGSITLASTTITGTVAVTQSTSPWIVAGGGTAGSPGTAVLTVQGISGGTPIPVSGTFTATGALTNNNAAPAATNLGVLPAIAETAYTTVTYTTGNQVLPVTDLHGALNQDLQAYAGTALTGTVTAYGTAPTGNVFGVNAFITNTVPVTLASTTITGTVAVTQSTSPWVVAGSLTNNNAAPTATLIGVLPAIAETAYNTVTYTTGDMVLPVTDLHGAWNDDLQAVAGVQLGATAVVAYGSTPAAVNVPAMNAFVTNTVAFAGTKSNNAVVPGATNLGVLPAIAATSYATNTYTNTDQVALVTDLNGAINSDLQAVAGTAVVTAAAGVQKVGIVGSAGGVMDAITTAATAPASALGTLVEFLSQANQPALTTGQSVMVQGDQTGATYVNTEGRKATFSASANFTGAAGVIAVLPGSATKTIRVLRVEVSIYTSGTAAIEVLSLIKTSSAPTGGTSAAMGIAPHDSGDAAVSAAPLSFTAAPTVGTAVATVRSVAFADSTAAIPPGSNTWLWDWGMRPGQAIVLRGTAQTLEVSLGGAVATQTCIVSYEWTEE